ncbi:hypothetical protein [Raoultibacter phocaeensis]|uniref:hypothetical protein n=1 Tax=Raoultibacter phocaeensis TaxID=2479841 RepID=UPI001118AD88|nr:hypothetical protein [Raoultibacter phocaeensis]
MNLDDELETLEDGVETEGIAAEDESDLEIEDEFEDTALGADADEETLEEVYKDFENDEADIDGAPAPNIGFEIVDLEDLKEEEEEADDEFIEVELEIDEDDIVSYLVDEDDNEIGFTMLDQEGNEVEYFYVEDDEAVTGNDDEDDDEFDLGITKEGVAQATTDINAIYKDGVAVAAELKGAFDDIKTAFDFKSVLKK